MLVWKGGSPSSAWGMGVTSQVPGRDRFPSCSPVGASAGPSLPGAGLRLTGADACLDPYDLELGLEDRSTLSGATPRALETALPRPMHPSLWRSLHASPGAERHLESQLPALAMG